MPFDGSRLPLAVCRLPTVVLKWAAMPEQYYIRVRGDVKGPFSTEQLRAQIRRKRIGRHHEVSVDGSTWEKAGDVPELFEPVVAAPRPTPAEEVEPVTNEPAKESAASSPAGTGAQPSDGKDWYYAKGGNKLGPVSSTDLQMWLSNGVLSAQDLVWHQDFDNWIPAGDLPQFAAAAARKSKATNAADYKKASFWEVFWGTSKAAQLPKDAIHKFPNLSRYLTIAEASFRALFALLLVAHVVGVIFSSGLEFRQGVYELGFGYLLGGLLGIPILWLLFLTGMAMLEIIRVLVSIEDNTARTAVAAGADS